MNLAVEYLVRTKVVRDFLEVPCSLFMTGDEGKIVITFDEGCDGGSLACRKWFVSQANHKQPLPEFDCFDSDVVSVFEDHRVFPPGCFIMEYEEEPVDHSANSYNHPMPGERYHQFVYQYLNSKSHRLAKEYWLWEAFSEVHFPGVDTGKWSRTPTNRRKILSVVGHGLLDKWNLWRETLVVDPTTTAAELVFKTCDTF